MSGLVISEFKRPVLKDVKIVQRDGNSPLIFVEFVDSETYATTGQMIFMSPDGKQQAHDLTPLKLQEVTAEIGIGVYQNRTSLTVLSIKKKA